MGDERSPRMTPALRACVATLSLAVLMACGGNQHAVRPRAAATQNLSAIASVDDGARIYITNCASCHQRDGRGLAGAFPALAANPAVTGDAGRVIAVVAFGSRSRTWDPGAALGSEMPAWEGLLPNGDIADVVSYIRSAWGNRAPPVSEFAVIQKLAGCGAHRSSKCAKIRLH